MLTKFLCKIFGHKWQFTVINSLVGCTRCLKMKYVIIPQMPYNRMPIDPPKMPDNGMPIDPPMVATKNIVEMIKKS